MHLYSDKGAIKKYNSTESIIKEWSKVRIRKYYERKNYQVKKLEKDYNILSTKIRFIIDVIEGKIKIMNVKLNVIADRLVELKYPKINVTDTDSDDESEHIKGYNYLIKMPISQLTMDRKIILEKEVEDLKNKLDNLKSTNIEQIWLSELNELLVKWKEHKILIEEDYNNDKNNIVKKVIKRKVKK